MAFPPKIAVLAPVLEPVLTRSRPDLGLVLAADLNGLFPMSQNHQKECEQGVSKAGIGC
jgi:hypothetical protein